ncbi:MAG: hypothetical protein RL757_905 [Bacteroidota bacterium]|jgi:hypothetical protein
MQTLNLWNNLHLRRRKGLTIAHFRRSIAWILGGIVFLTATHARAQTRDGNYNFAEHQRKNYYFGITLGYNKGNYNVYRGKNFILNDSVAGVESAGGQGFNLNIISNLRLGDHFDVRFMPGFSFTSRSLTYDATRKGRPDYPNKIESVFVELPFHVRYTSNPYYDKRLFIVGGLKYTYDIQSRSRIRTLGGLVKISPTDFQFEYGFGMQMYFPYFIFSPELKVSQGLGNILIYNPNLRESTVLERLLSRTFCISFHFEG